MITSGNKDRPDNDRPDNDRPDKDIEECWFGIKIAVRNCFSSIKIEPNIDLKSMSDILNDLQTNENYVEIEKNILANISSICKQYIVHNIDTYHSHLLDVHIRRWNNLTTKYQFFENQNIMNVVDNCVYFYIYYKVITNKDKYPQLLKDFTGITELPSISRIIDVSIANNYPYILDKCNKITCVATYVNCKYSVDCYKNTQGSKIIAYLNNHWYSE